MSAADPIRITVEGFDQVIDCRPGERFLDAAARAGLAIATACGGEGRCRSCAVRVVSGAVPEPGAGEAGVFSAAQLDMGWRRACRMQPLANTTLHVPRRSLMAGARHLIPGRAFAALPVDAQVRAVSVRLPVQDPLAWNYAGLLKVINNKEIRFDTDVLHELGPVLRRNKGQVRIFLRADEVIGIGARNARALGVAVDLGTTSVSAYLINLGTGVTLAAITTANPQARFGGDVVTRLARAIRSEDDRKAMREVIVRGINGLIGDLCANAMTTTDQVVDLVIAGNTAMHHLFAGLPVAQLARVPFTPALTKALDIKARDLGLEVAPGAYVHLPGIIAGYVGADHSAALLASGENLGDDLTLIVDIGTNTEISLLEGGRILSASCPSGPALEGGQISCGMPAVAGAISAVKITGDAVALTTIGDAPPVGLCGSGVLDVVAQLYLGGAVNAGGRLDKAHPRVTARGGRLEFVLLKDGVDGQISFSQDDIRAVQLAKAAIRAGIDLLLKTAGRREADIRRILIAGAFGSHIELNSAIITGLLPDLASERFEQIGNAAGQGARLALTSARHRLRAQELARNATHVELAGHGEFMRVFVARMGFGTTAPAGIQEKIQ
jgi:uncharacterized 2Fe-2S/4Fe-4S cluster protein (DUF4445 family)